MLRIASALLLLAAPLAAFASPITYVVNDTFSGFSIKGSVTTDGTIGTIKTANITSYSFLLTEGSKTLTLDTTDSAQRVSGAGLTADAYNLYFAFGSSSEWLIQDPIIGAGTNFLCFQSKGDYCYTPGYTPGIGISIANTSPGTADVYEAMKGKQQIAAITPEPSSLVLLGTGLLGFAGMARRRFIKA